jgi:hypothetical protein
MAPAAMLIETRMVREIAIIFVKLSAVGEPYTV